VQQKSFVSRKYAYVVPGESIHLLFPCATSLGTRSLEIQRLRLEIICRFFASILFHNFLFEPAALSFG
jgi:hypothetical protein